jgi:selenocysteine lyase/cysteine desulfurase
MSHTLTTRRGFLGALAAAAVSPAMLTRLEEIDRALARGLPRRTAGTGPEVARALSAQYMLSEDILYLNHASIGTVPRAVHEAHVAYLELCESHPSLYVWGPAWRELTEETRASAAGLLRCDPDDLAVTHNTTEGFNVLAHGLPLRRGDEVLFSSLNHPGASVPWTGLAETRGFDVRRFEFPLERADRLDEEEVVALHVGALSPRTRVLVFPHVDNMIGLRHPVRSLAAAAKDRGVEFVLVDGAQAAGMIPLDLRGSGADAYAMSPHKWLQSPKGLGLLYVAPQLRTRLPPMWFRTPRTREEGSARQYEDYSTRAWPAVAALGDALAFQLALGENEKVERYRDLRRRIRDRVDAEPGLRWRSPREWPLGSMIVAVSVAGRDASALAGPLLHEHGLVLRAFGPPFDALRLSPNVATSEEEVDRALDALAASA